MKSFDSAQHSKLYILRLKNGRVSTVMEKVLEELATMTIVVFNGILLQYITTLPSTFGHICWSVTIVLMDWKLFEV